ncbi:MAG: TIGR00730 family Rossman fold protein [Planctomycetes bacterium]|nr:TIGR00730 family Rossman fold protein [Planctomycetota bacterium]
MKRICVFCGSSAGFDSTYRQSAIQFGKLLVDRGHELVYGAGSVGLMGAVADAVLQANGHVIGVIPRFLATRELLHEGISDIRLTDDMHERKALMSELSDAFVALPGGLGTFEELFEVLTWAQLGLHSKPIGILNMAGYFDPLVALLDRAILDGFCRDEHRRLFIVDNDPVRLLERMRDHQPPAVRKWIPSTNET